MKIVCEELKRMGLSWDSATLLREKDGITVARVKEGESSRVIKCFQKESHRREIENYRLLSELGIPTLRLIARTDSAILMEDLDHSPRYRLGVEEDLSAPKTARAIAAWYRELHRRGYEYIAQHGQDMYDETDYFTLENIALIKEQTRTQSLPAWAMLERNFDAIHAQLCQTRRTLNYNDFDHSNLAVARDGASALMFDYNLLGKGYAYNDLRNVTWAMPPEAAGAFWEAYGGFDPRERLLDDVVSVVTALYMACQRETFPAWAQGILNEVSEDYSEKIEALMKG